MLNHRIQKPHSLKSNINPMEAFRTGEFYWAIECKNRRQEIGRNDVLNAIENAEEASSRWNLKPVKPAVVSSSIYNRIPEGETLPIITTGNVFVPDKEFFYKYKDTFGSWYIKPVTNVPNDLVNLIDEKLVK